MHRLSITCFVIGDFFVAGLSFVGALRFTRRLGLAWRHTVGPSCYAVTLSAHFFCWLFPLIVGRSCWVI